MRVSGCEKINKFRVGDDACRTVVFCDPLGDVGSNVCASMSAIVSQIFIMAALTETQGLCVRNERK